MWWIGIIIGLALMVVAYLLMPKPKKQKPAAAADLEAPTAEAGRPIPVLWGSAVVKGVNILWYGEKSVAEYEVDA